MSRVLVVDDVTATRKVLVALLAGAGYDVCAAADAATARRLFAEEHPEFVITDMQMTGEDGVSLARSLRESAAGNCVRIALVSGDADIASRDDGLFDAVLAKPVTLMELRGFLEGRQA